MIAGGQLVIWDIETGEALRTISDPKSPMTAVAWSPSGDVVATGSAGGSVCFWNPDTGVQLASASAHSGGVAGLAFSEGGSILVTAGTNAGHGEVKVWKSLGLTLVKTLPGSLPGVWSVAVDRDGRYVAAGDRDHMLLWDLKSEKAPIARAAGPRFTFSASGLLVCLQSAADVSTPPTSLGDQVDIIDPTTGNNKLTIPETYGMLDVAISPDCRTLAVSAFGGGVVLFDMATGRQIADLHGSDVRVDWGVPGLGRNVAITTDEIYSDTERVDLWNIANDRPSRTLNPKTEFMQSISQLCLSRDGKRLYGLYAGGIKVWDTSTGRELRAITAPAAPGTIMLFQRMDVSPDERWVVTGSSVMRLTSGQAPTSAYGTRIDLWDAQTGQWVKTLVAPDWQVGYSPDSQPLMFGLQISPDGKTLAASDDKHESLQLYDLDTGTPEGSLTGAADFIQCLAFRGDGKVIAAGDHSGKVTLWDCRSRVRLNQLQAHVGGVSAIAFSQDGSLLLTGGDDDSLIKVWDASTAALRQILSDHTGSITSIAVLLDGNRFLSTSYDGAAKLWQFDRPGAIATFVPIGADDYAIVTPDGYYSISRGAYYGVAFRVGLHAYPFEQFDLRLNRPDKVLEALGSTDTRLIDQYRAAYESRLEALGFTEQELGGDFHLPSCTITSTPPLTTNDRSILFSVSAGDSTYTLDRLLVTDNNVPVDFACAGRSATGQAGLSLRVDARKSFVGQAQMALSAGANRIQVSVMNSEGVESLRQTFTVNCGAPAHRDLYVLAVGVSQYPAQSGLPQLNSADADAQAIAAFFQSQAGAYADAPHIKVLVNSDATHDSILQARSFLAQSTEDDEVVVFFAGHGFFDNRPGHPSIYYYAGHDIDVSDPQTHGITYDQMAGLLDGLRARRKLLLIDTCHAGDLDPSAGAVAGTRSGGRGFGPLYSTAGLQDAFDLQEDLFADLRRGSGATVIAAARGEETAGETTAHGLFTQAVLDSLQAHPTETVSQLRNAVSSAIAQQTGGSQRPVTRGENLADDFPIVPPASR